MNKCPCSLPLYKKKLVLEDLAFFWTLYCIELAEKILLSFFCIKLFTHELHLTKQKHHFLIFSWGLVRGGGDHLTLFPAGRRGTSSKPPFLSCKLWALNLHWDESSTAVQSSQPVEYKTDIVVHGLYTHQGLNSFFQLNQAKDGVLFYSI